MESGEEIGNGNNLKSHCFYPDSSVFYFWHLERKESNFFLLFLWRSWGKTKSQKGCCFHSYTCAWAEASVWREWVNAKQIPSTSEVGSLGLTHIPHMSGIKADCWFVHHSTLSILNQYLLLFFLSPLLILLYLHYIYPISQLLQDETKWLKKKMLFSPIHGHRPRALFS